MARSYDGRTALVVLCNCRSAMPRRRA